MPLCKTNLNPSRRHFKSQPVSASKPREDSATAPLESIRRLGVRSYTSRMATGAFTRRYLSALEDLGEPADSSHRLAGPLHDWLPLSLKELYRIAGNHPINCVHHRLLLPDEIERQDNWVVFAEENQQVVVWAFDQADHADDPLVWQGQPDPSDAARLVWYPEDRALSDFMIEMWTWIKSGE